MKDDIPEEAKAQAERFENAQQDYLRFAKNLRALIDLHNPEGLPTSLLPKETRSLCREFETSLNHVNKQEAEFAKKCEAITGVISGGALDLDSARSEILGRVTRIRERTGC